MERPRIRPEDRTRIPDLYEVVKIEEVGIRWTGARFKSHQLEAMQRAIRPPYVLAPITFKNAPQACDSLAVNKSVA